MNQASIGASRVLGRSARRLLGTTLTAARHNSSNVATLRVPAIRGGQRTTTINSRPFNSWPFNSLPFNPDTAAAKRAAQAGPMLITDRGWPAPVLQSIHAHRRLSGEQRSLVDLHAMAEDVERVIPCSPCSGLSLQSEQPEFEREPKPWLWIARD